jgi:hypothetical protein
MEALKLHQRHNLIYSVDEAGPKLTYNSDNKKLLAVKGSTTIHRATKKEKGETVTSVVCMSACGSNWIVPVVLCDGKLCLYNYVAGTYIAK